jgi:hypothetical protein
MKTTAQKIKCQALKKEIESLGFDIVAQDFDRPWGGFLVIEEAQAQAFSNYFFKGLDETSVVAEIWQHTDANYPSDEDDIVRVQDYFGR